MIESAAQDENVENSPSLGSVTASVLGPVRDAVAAPWRLMRGYRIGDVRGDVLSAVTVALVAVPQSMAFAEIAGLGAAVGLYTMIVGAIVGGLFTSSRHLSIGPTNTMAILTLAAVSLAPGDATPEQRITFAATVALLAGLMQICFALLRMGELVRYVSHSVIVGFSAGAGVLIAVKQVPAFLGVSLAGVESNLEGLAKTVHRLIQATDGADWQAIVVGGVSLGVALICRKISKWLPAYLLAVIMGALMVWGLNWTHGELRLVGELPSTLPSPSLSFVSFDMFGQLLLPAAAIALVGMIEAYGIGKTLAGRTGDRMNASQEFVAQGVTNIALSLFRGMPATGSFSRTALSFDAGARTRAACVFSGFLVAAVFLLLAPAAKFIPMASIAAILFPIAYGLIDWRYARRLVHSNHADLAVCIGTFVATITISLELAVFVGVFLNIALYLRRARQVFVNEMLRDDGSPTGLIERPLKGDSRATHNAEAIVFLQLEGNLFFAAADELQDRFAQVMHGGAKAVILRLKRTHMVDASVMHVFEQFAEQMHQRGRHVLLCGVRPRMKQRMDEFGLSEIFGEEHIFTTGNDLFASAKAAITKARELTGAEIANARGDTAQGTSDKTWAYDI
ncbi:MAG: SulP family inorganic anion transporter [Planctomycetota bacterium]